MVYLGAASGGIHVIGSSIGCRLDDTMIKTICRRAGLVEILSKDDTMTQMQERIDDYLQFGVRYV